MRRWTSAGDVIHVRWTNVARYVDSAAQLTFGDFDAQNPAFDPKGRYLYFLSNRDHNLSFSSYEFNYLYTNATRIYAATLAADGPALGRPLVAAGLRTLDHGGRGHGVSPSRRRRHRSRYVGCNRSRGLADPTDVVD